MVVFATTGPGIMNALTGLVAARWEGAKVLLVSGATSPAVRGRWAFQETSAYTMPIAALLGAGPVFHLGVALESAAEVDEIVRRLAMGFARRQGFVAHLSLPLSLQTAPGAPARGCAPLVTLPAGCNEGDVARCAELLGAGPFAIWVGFGARYAAQPILALAQQSGALVLCSPRAKGVFPEDHPQFVGVTGLGGDPAVPERLARQGVQRTLVLGSRLGELTSFWDPGLVPPHGFVHVDLEPDVPGVAYPNAETVAVQAEIGAFAGALVDRLPRRTRAATLSAMHARDARASFVPRSGPVRVAALMSEIQRVVVDGSDAVVLTEAGNAFAWGSCALRFGTPGRYRVSTGFGSMGQATAGVLGAALGRAGKAVAIVGDGAMLMNSEVSTAAEQQVPAVWIVLNDGRYGMIDRGMRSLGWTPFAPAIPRCDFAAVARAMGAEGARVEREQDIGAALEQAMAARGPFVVDVLVDPDEIAPAMRRNESLADQGAAVQRRPDPQQEG